MKHFLAVWTSIPLPFFFTITTSAFDYHFKCSYATFACFSSLKVAQQSSLVIVPFNACCKFFYLAPFLFMVVQLHIRLVNFLIFLYNEWN
jgi:hypothetical protein